MTFINLWKKSALTPPLSANGFCTKSDEEELNQLYTRLQVLEESSKKIVKNLKRYEDSLINVNKIEQKLSQEMCPSSICIKSSTLRQLGEDYYSVAAQATNLCQSHIDTCHKTVMEPIRRYNTVFNGIAAAMKERDQCLQEVLKLHSKLEKLQEKERNASNLSKIAQTKKDLQISKDSFTCINRDLINDLNHFLDRKTAYFHPSLQALVQSQVAHHKETVYLFNELCDKALIDAPMKDYDMEMAKLFGNLKSLSIVCDK